mmetsp:Transcript_18614/g.51260  ORF Transcript_18614/g.51260 Transcript_18614/m.51260 type:complete len:317 (+) Transcript_18614:132-1082(+)
MLSISKTGLAKGGLPSDEATCWLLPIIRCEDFWRMRCSSCCFCMSWGRSGAFNSGSRGALHWRGKTGTSGGGGAGSGMPGGEACLEERQEPACWRTWRLHPALPPSASKDGLLSRCLDGWLLGLKPASVSSAAAVFEASEGGRLMERPRACVMSLRGLYCLPVGSTLAKSSRQAAYSSLPSWLRRSPSSSAVPRTGNKSSACLRESSCPKSGGRYNESARRPGSNRGAAAQPPAPAWGAAGGRQGGRDSEARLFLQEATISSTKQPLPEVVEDGLCGLREVEEGEGGGREAGRCPEREGERAVNSCKRERNFDSRE